jgi:hypothetical protein
MALKDAKRCTAMSKRTGEACQNPATRGFDVCRNHGGLSLRGIAHPNFKTGLYSKLLPVRLAADYHAAKSDAKLLELRDDAALLHARIADLLSRVDTGEAGQKWKALKRAFSALMKARDVLDAAAMSAAMYDLSQIIDQGFNDFATWNEINALLEQRRKVVDSETRRLVLRKLMISTDEANVLFAAMVVAITRHVTDEATLQKLSEEFDRLTINYHRADESVH